jgi:glycosyltransferase involved in cell wall biosynthesis/phage shock protein A
MGKAIALSLAQLPTAPRLAVLRRDFASRRHHSRRLADQSRIIVLAAPSGPTMIRSSMPHLPKVAIITRTRNRPVFLERAIQSVLGQTYSDWIHVIVNDGGEREQLETLANPYQDAYQDRLRLLHQAHSGMQTAANNGIQQSDSTYIVIHDDDDSWHPEFLEKTVAFLDAKGPDSPYQGVISETVRVLENLDEKGFFSEINRTPYVPLKEISLFRVGYENPFPPIAFLYRRSVHQKIGDFDPQWDIVADLDFNFRFLRLFEIGVVHSPLACYHWRPDDCTDPSSANSVTLRANEHGRRLNELKNHYFRVASSSNEAAAALGFQLSAFAVENQWMTTEIRDKTFESLHHLRGLAAQVLSLQENGTALASLFHDSLWPKVSKHLPQQLDAQHQQLAHLGETASRAHQQLDTLHQQLAHLHQSNSHSHTNAFEALTSQRSILDKMGSILTEEFWPKLAHDIPQLLHTLQAEAELSRNHSAHAFVEIGRTIAHLSKAIAETFTLLENTHAFQQHLRSNMESQLSGLKEDQGKLSDKMAAVEETLQTIVSQKTLLQIGPLRLQWSRHKPTR